MALFVVRHRHGPERCPAVDPIAGAELLNYLSRPNVRRHGIETRGEAVLQGQHTLWMIVESSDRERVSEFMKPFAAAGEVEVLAASTCARVVTSGGCAAPYPAIDGDVLDPEEACQDAIEAGLVVHRAHPLNCETSREALIGGVVMPNAHFYVRNHFHIPQLAPGRWQLKVGGLVERPLSLARPELKKLRSQSVVVTLECAGNGRSQFRPPVAGEQWRLGAVSTAEWTGVPLAELLERCGATGAARKVVFRGADAGAVPGHREPARYERSLSLEDTRESGALLAYGMNGEPLPIQHGYPLRLIVPGWYAMASVKWLTEIELIDGTLDGHFQTGTYFYEHTLGGDAVREPVRLQNVRSLITEPADGEELGLGELAIRGVAWSGAAPIAKVEVSVNGDHWRRASLVGEPNPHSWRWWELITRIDQPGRTIVRARATDQAGRTQTDRANWNRLGYGNNAIQEAVVRVR